MIHVENKLKIKRKKGWKVSRVPGKGLALTKKVKEGLENKLVINGKK